MALLEGKTGKLVSAVAEEAIAQGVNAAAQFTEHSIGGPKGLVIPKTGVPASFALGAFASILSNFASGTTKTTMAKAGLALRSGAIAKLAAKAGLEHHDKDDED